MPLNTNFSYNDAYRIINNVIDERIRQLSGSGAGVDITWGTVASIDSPYECSVYLYGEDTPSAGFRLENGIKPNYLDPVRVAMDKRGNRWIEGIGNNPDDASALSFNIRNGIIVLGRTTDPLSPSATVGISVDYITGTRLYTDNGFIIGNTVDITGLSDQRPAFMIGALNYFNLGFDYKNIQARNNGAVSVLNLNKYGGNVVFGGEAQSLGEAWIAPTLTNSWVNYGGVYNPVGYRKDASGYVHIRGMVKSGTLGSQIFTLPAGYQPANQELRIVISNNALGRVDISSGGSVTPSATYANNTYISLDGIIFKAGG